jgi:hypothetical protein
VAEAQAGADRPRATWTHDLHNGEYPHVARVSELFGAEVNEHQYLAGLHRILGPDPSGSTPTRVTARARKDDARK